MEHLLGFCFFAYVLLMADARGPLCLQCQAVESPDSCTNVIECLPGESCFSEHFIFANGTPAFHYGCRMTKHCPSQDVAEVTKRFDLRLCQACCNGDVCNYKVCRNGTAPPPGIPCLSCSDVPATNRCNKLTYCQEGEVCYTEKSTSSVDDTFNMGCLNAQICKYFEAEIIGRRSVKAIPVTEFTPCHTCCNRPGCNYGSCSIPQTGNTDGPTTTTTTTETTSPRPPMRDCWDLLTNYGMNSNGVYLVLSPSGRLVHVRCDMTTDGGGWTVFQRRLNGHVSFNRTYAQYQAGFGDPYGEFWMGNSLLHDFTYYRNQTLRVDLCSWRNHTRHAIYKTFSIGPASDLFRLHVGNYEGDAGDALVVGSKNEYNHSEATFSAPDNDNDLSSVDCAQRYSCGWWFVDCFSANLNGVYQFSDNNGDYDGIQWLTWLKAYSLKGAEMKIRPSDAKPSSHSGFACPVQ